MTNADSFRRTSRVLLLLALGLAAGALAVPPEASQPPAAAEAYRDRNDNIDPATRAAGLKVYGEVCAACHDVGANRAPQRFILEQMTPESIHRALVSGVMKQVGDALSADEKSAVAQYVSKRRFGAADAARPLMCKGKAALFDRAEPPIFSGWGLDPASTHAIPADVAGLNRANVGTLKLKWAFAFPNALRARSQPALAGGAIFVGSHDGTVYALDRETGCARWTFNASAEVRTGIVVSPWTAGDVKARPLLYFGDLVGNVYALDAVTGRQIWRKTVDTHAGATMTGTPSLWQDRLYVPVSSLEEGTAGKGGTAYGKIGRKSGRHSRRLGRSLDGLCHCEALRRGRRQTGPRGAAMPPGRWPRGWAAAASPAISPARTTSPRWRRRHSTLTVASTPRSTMPVSTCQNRSSNPPPRGCAARPRYISSAPCCS